MLILAKVFFFSSPIFFFLLKLWYKCCLIEFPAFNSDGMIFSRSYPRWAVMFPGVHPSSKTEVWNTSPPLRTQSLREKGKHIYIPMRGNQKCIGKVLLEKWHLTIQFLLFPFWPKTDFVADAIHPYPYMPDGLVPQGCPAAPMCLTFLSPSHAPAALGPGN